MSATTNINIYNPCRFYLSSYCVKGENCDFYHDPNHKPNPRPLCRNFSAGYCSYGSKCWYSHKNDETNAAEQSPDNPKANIPDLKSKIDQPSSLSAQTASKKVTDSAVLPSKEPDTDTSMNSDTALSPIYPTHVDNFGDSKFLSNAKKSARKKNLITPVNSDEKNVLSGVTNDTYSPNRNSVCSFTQYDCPSQLSSAATPPNMCSPQKQLETPIAYQYPSFRNQRFNFPTRQSALCLNYCQTGKCPDYELYGMVLMQNTRLNPNVNEFTPKRQLKSVNKFVQKKFVHSADDKDEGGSMTTNEKKNSPTKRSRVTLKKIHKNNRRVDIKTEGTSCEYNRKNIEKSNSNESDLMENVVKVDETANIENIHSSANKNEITITIDNKPIISDSPENKQISHRHALDMENSDNTEEKTLHPFGVDDNETNDTEHEIIASSSTGNFNQNIISDEKMTQKDNYPITSGPGFLPGCPYLHGNLCDYCSRWVLHPLDNKCRQDHIGECKRLFEEDMEESFLIKESSEQTCGICFEKTYEAKNPQQRCFGLLVNCNHVFCLHCIRDWRAKRYFAKSVVKGCPVCRMVSDYVVPSRYWYESANVKKSENSNNENVEQDQGSSEKNDKDQSTGEMDENSNEKTDVGTSKKTAISVVKGKKEEVIERYKRGLKNKSCKYFNKGKGTCPFYDKCFYKHAYPDGRLASPKPRPPRRRRFSKDMFEFLAQLRFSEIDFGDLIASNVFNEYHFSDESESDDDLDLFPDNLYSWDDDDEDDDDPYIFLA